MKAGWIRRAFVALLLALTPALTFAAQKQPAWVSKIEAGSVVQVVMQTGESFDAIWMGRDSDRAARRELGRVDWPRRRDRLLGFAVTAVADGAVPLESLR